MSSPYRRLSVSASSLGSSTDSSGSSPAREEHTPLGLIAQRLFPYRYDSMSKTPVTPAESDTVVLTLDQFIRRIVGVHDFPKLYMQPIGPCRWQGVCFCSKRKTRAHASLLLDTKTEVFTLQVAAALYALDLRFRADSQFYKFKVKTKKSNILTLTTRTPLHPWRVLNVVLQQPWRFATIVAMESYRDECKETQSMTFTLNTDTVSQSDDQWENAVWEEEEAHGLHVHPMGAVTADLGCAPGLVIMDFDYNIEYDKPSFDQADISLDIKGNEVLVLRKFQARRNPKYSPIQYLTDCANSKRVVDVVYY